MALTVGSLFSGIGGFDLGFERAGFHTIWRCETEPFCRRILATKLSEDVPIHGDVRKVSAKTVEPVDILIGGFPCQDLSVAGLGKGFDGARSSLFFQFVRLIQELKPKLWVIENVPGFFRSPRRFPGKDFAIALAVLDRGGSVGGWRVLDSQYFGLAQRRARVFLVGGPRGLNDCAQEILFESESSAWNSQACDEARTRVAATLRGRSARAGVNEPGRGGEDDENLICFDWQSGGDVRSTYSSSSSSLQASQVPAVLAYTLSENIRNRSQGPANYIGVHANQRGELSGTDNLVHALTTQHGVTEDGTGRGVPLTPNGMRRLTPLECERLQGFPDGWTCLCGEGHRGSRFCSCKDTPRYKALGNAVSVPVAEWIARRILALQQ